MIFSAIITKATESIEGDSLSVTQTFYGAVGQLPTMHEVEDFFKSDVLFQKPSPLATKGAAANNAFELLAIPCFNE